MIQSVLKCPRRVTGIVAAVVLLSGWGICRAGEKPPQPLPAEIVAAWTNAGLKSLTSLNLNGTKVTDAGVAELQKALPKCKIDR